MSTNPDRIPVVAPPPLLYAAGIGLGWLAHGAWPLPLAFPGAHALGWTLVAAGLALAAWSVAAFHRAATTVNPYGGTTRIVDSGPFRYSRNPMYVAMALVHAGAAPLLGSVWVVLALVPVLALIRYSVIAREEAYLTRKFGEPYAAYCRRVRRWL